MPSIPLVTICFFGMTVSAVRIPRPEKPHWAPIRGGRHAKAAAKAARDRRPSSIKKY